MWHLMQFAEYGMLKTQLMAVAGLQRIKLAKQKVGKKKKKKRSHVSITKPQKIDTKFFFAFCCITTFLPHLI